MTCSLKCQHPLAHPHASLLIDKAEQAQKGSQLSASERSLLTHLVCWQHQHLDAQAQVRTFQQAGHTPFLSQPGEFYPVVRAFLQQP